MDELDTILGTLTGTAVAGFAQWVRYDNRTQDKLTNNTNTLRDLRDAFLDQASWGDAVRSRAPIVQDWQSGIAIASQTQTTPSAIPSVPSATARPNLCQSAESAVSAFAWPPRQGQYDERWNVKQIGELSTTSLALTFEEVRAAIHGLILCNGSTAAQRVEIYRAVNALVETVSALGLTKAQFADAWARVFAAATAATLDPHRDPSKSPTISNVVNVTGVTFITAGSNGEQNPQTDNAHRLNVINGGIGIVTAYSPICRVSFATEYKYRKADQTVASFVPVVQPHGSRAQFYAVASSTGYDLFCSSAIAGGESATVLVIVEPGVITIT